MMHESSPPLGNGSTMACNTTSPPSNAHFQMQHILFIFPQIKTPYISQISDQRWSMFALAYFWLPWGGVHTYSILMGNPQKEMLPANLLLAVFAPRLGGFVSSFCTFAVDFVTFWLLLLVGCCWYLFAAFAPQWGRFVSDMLRCLPGRRTQHCIVTKHLSVITYHVIGLYYYTTLHDDKTYVSHLLVLGEKTASDHMANYKLIETMYPICDNTFASNFLFWSDTENTDHLLTTTWHLLKTTWHLLTTTWHLLTTTWHLLTSTWHLLTTTCHLLTTTWNLLTITWRLPTTNWHLLKT